jgi:DNA-binding NtrC family response regulator
MADILLVDDDSELVQSLVRVLSRLVAPRSVVAAGNAKKAIELCVAEQPLVAVIDLCLDEKIGVESGFELLRALKATNPELRVLVLTGHGSLAHGIRAMGLGAASFLEKPADPEHLAALLKDGIAQAELRRAYNELSRENNRGGLGELSGTSTAVQRLREEIEFVSTTNQPVLLLGETGTGKSLCARLIHEHSKRRHKKFIHYHPNFGGGDIVQSELFGHTKGSFTGAVENRRGLVLEGDGGTLFIDELDAVPVETQVTLLDLVQEQRVRPIGSDVFQKVDCRCIAATNRPIQQALESGSIRRDLHHRLAHCIIKLPALRERLSDLPLLIESSLRKLREREGLNVFEVEPQALARCAAYAWPGNIRELQGVVESAAYRAQFKGRPSIYAEDLQIGQSEASSTPTGLAESRPFHEQVEIFKRTLIRQALDACGGNQVQAASMLGVDRGTIRRLS